MTPRPLLAVSALAVLLTLSACLGYDPRYDPPTASPAASSQPEPSASASSTLHVVLAQATSDDVTIDVTDASGTLLTAASGTPGDGASVEPSTIQVANEGPSTLRLTWVGGPCDSANSLSIDAAGRQFVLVQPECSGDSIAVDRVLILEFSRPIASSAVEAILQDGLDTAG